MKKNILFVLTLFPITVFSQSPNFVFILADDMGWTGTSVQVSPTESGSISDFYYTPNLEQLAAEGMTFSQAYAPAAKCSPSRNSILTGESTARNNFTETDNQISPNQILIEAATTNNIDQNDVTIGEWLHSTGDNYRTAHFGKWHLGSGGTNANGFDEGDGNTSNNDGNATTTDPIQNDPKKIMELTNKGIAFMQSAVNDNVPFYLQISHYAVHTQIETTQASFDYFNAQPPGVRHDNVGYAGMTKDLDDGIGLILNEIENLGIEGKTYVIFLSDNGASNGLSTNQPLRRGKSFIYEGGIRVPLIIKGPNIPANTFSAEPAVGYDLFPTIAELTESNEPLPSTLDGKSLVPIFNQQPFNRQKSLFFHIPHYATNMAQSPRSAAVNGDYKLIVEYETGIDYLYDLNMDIAESNNIASSNNAIANTLKIELRDYLKSVNANLPQLDPTHANFTGTAPDIDDDGLNDEWEFRELLNYTYGPNDDPDGDGLDNLTEFNEGFDPLRFDLVNVNELLKKENTVIIFPNPTDGILNLKFKNTDIQRGELRIQIINSMGQILQEFQREHTNVLSLSLEGLENGMYSVRIKEDGIPIALNRFVYLK